MQLSPTFLSLAIALGANLVVDAAPIQLGSNGDHASLLNLDTASDKPSLVTSHVNTNKKDKNVVDVALNLCHDKILGHLVDCKTGKKLAPKSDSPSHGSPSPSGSKPAHPKAASHTDSKPKPEHESGSTSSHGQHKSGSGTGQSQHEGGSKHQSNKHTAKTEHPAAAPGHNGDRGSPSVGQPSCGSDHSLLEIDALDKSKGSMDVKALPEDKSGLKVDALPNDTTKGPLSIEDHDATLLRRADKPIAKVDSTRKHQKAPGGKTVDDEYHHTETKGQKTKSKGQHVASKGPQADSKSHQAKSTGRVAESKGHEVGKSRSHQAKADGRQAASKGHNTESSEDHHAEAKAHDSESKAHREAKMTTRELDADDDEDPIDEYDSYEEAPEELAKRGRADCLRRGRFVRGGVPACLRKEAARLAADKKAEEARLEQQQVVTRALFHGLLEPVLKKHRVRRSTEEEDSHEPESVADNAADKKESSDAEDFDDGLDKRRFNPALHRFSRLLGRPHGPVRAEKQLLAEAKAQPMTERGLDELNAALATHVDQLLASLEGRDSEGNSMIDTLQRRQYDLLTAWGGDSYSVVPTRRHDEDLVGAEDENSEDRKISMPEDAAHQSEMMKRLALPTCHYSKTCDTAPTAKVASVGDRKHPVKQVYRPARKGSLFYLGGLTNRRRQEVALDEDFPNYGEDHVERRQDDIFTKWGGDSHSLVPGRRHDEDLLASREVDVDF